MAERVLVTGATGFVGQAVCRHFARQGFVVRALVRGACETCDGVEVARVGDFESLTVDECAKAMEGVQVVIHCAALVHQMRGVKDPENYYRVNTEATKVLVTAAVESGVRRFIFLSTIKVLGESSRSGRPFKANDSAAPQNDYAISKWHAEEFLSGLDRNLPMDYVVVRLPLVYGPGVGGNFASLMHLVEKGIPLPLGAVHNRRSMLALPNLVELLEKFVLHDSKLNDVFHASDGEDVSIAELISAMAKSRGVSPRLWPVPVEILRLCAKLLGKESVVERLCGDLQVDIEKTRKVVSWSPRRTLIDVLSGEY